MDTRSELLHKAKEIRKIINSEIDLIDQDYNLLDEENRVESFRRGFLMVDCLKTLKIFIDSVKRLE